MQPYTPGKPISEVQRELGLSHIVKLASNENPLGPSPKATAAIQAALESLHQYPDASGYELKAALGRHLGVDSSYLAIGNGSDELIHLLGLVTLTSESNIVVGDPTFVRYAAAGELAEASIKRVALDREYRHDLSAMAEAVDENTRLVLIANPHNPTGTTVGESELRAFIARLPKSVVVVLDEAYFEYAQGTSGHPNGVEFVMEGLPVVVLRTFSKAYGLAGIRVGYMIAAPEIIDALNRAREPFDVNSLAQAGAIAALQDAEFLNRTVRTNGVERDRFMREMTRRGYTTIPSAANFVCVDVRQNAGPVFQNLLERGVVVRNGSPLGMPNFLRVSIGTEQEMDQFYQAFDAVVTHEVTL